MPIPPPMPPRNCLEQGSVLDDQKASLVDMLPSLSSWMDSAAKNLNREQNKVIFDIIYYLFNARMTKSYPDDLLLIGPLVALFLLLWPPPSADAALRMIGDLKQSTDVYMYASTYV
jgi:hypothetical protein